MLKSTNLVKGINSIIGINPWQIYLRKSNYNYNYNKTKIIMKRNSHSNIQESFWSTSPLTINVIVLRTSLKLTIPSPSLSKLLNTICAYLVGLPNGNNLMYTGFKSPVITHPLGHNCLKVRYSLRISSLEKPVRQVRVDSCSGKMYSECLSSSGMLSMKM